MPALDRLERCQGKNLVRPFLFSWGVFLLRWQKLSKEVIAVEEEMRKAKSLQEQEEKEEEKEEEEEKDLLKKDLFMESLTLEE